MKNYDKLGDITLSISEDCIDKERQIIKTYWELRDNVIFNNTPTTVADSFDLGKRELIDLIKSKSLLKTELLCSNCNLPFLRECTSQTGFNFLLQGLRNNKDIHCNSCEQIIIQKELEKEKQLQIELNRRLIAALKSKNWEGLDDDSLEVLHCCKSMSIDELKIMYYHRNNQDGYKLLFRSLFALERLDLVNLIRWDGSSAIKEIKTHPELANYFSYDPILRVDQEIDKNSDFNIISKSNHKADYIKMKLTANNTSLNPDRPRFGGTIVFPKRIDIIENIEYAWAAWNKANGDLFLHLYPTDSLEKLPAQRRMEALPIHLKQGITKLFENIDFNSDIYEDNEGSDDNLDHVPF